jgi:hypothetical protein
VQQFAVSGNVQADKHNWESQQSYYYWEIGERGSCDIAGQAEIPDSLTTRDSIPTTALIQIMKNADELLRAAMARDDAPKLRHPTLHWRLAELSLSSVLQPDVGFGYHARYDAVGATAGPSVFFSLTDSGFEVHSVGEWVY